MAMIRSHDGVLDARCSKLPDRSRQVIYNRIHYLPRLEREARFPCVVYLLRAHHDDLGAVEFLGEPRRLQTQELVERDINQVRYARCSEFLTSRKVRKKYIVD